MKPKRMVLGLIPNNKCNLKCTYCYISQMPEWMQMGDKFQYSVEHIAKCLSVERLGGVSLINLTGEGETMLQVGIVDLCRLLMEEGHYIELVTNLTVTKVVDQFMELPRELLEQLEFKISFHYMELKRLNLLEKFFVNVDKVQNSGCSFTLELMPHDEIIPEIDRIIDLCKKRVGAKCQVTVGRADYLPSRSILSELSKDDYVKTWGKFESPMFDLKMDLLDVKRGEFCYAGDWTIYVNMYTGEASPCYSQPYRQNIFTNPSKPIKFIPVGRHCAQPYCINGHAHISLGVIPELKAPTYAMIRNRVRDDGTEWFSEKGKDFFDSKLGEMNEEYSSTKKNISDITWYARSAGFVLKNPDKIVKRVRLFFTKRKRLAKEIDNRQGKQL